MNGHKTGGEWERNGLGGDQAAAGENQMKIQVEMSKWAIVTQLQRLGLELYKPGGLHHVIVCWISL